MPQAWKRDRRYRNGGHLTGYGKLIIFLVVVSLALAVVTHGFALILAGLMLAGWAAGRHYRNQELPPAPPPLPPLPPPPQGETRKRVAHSPEVKIAVWLRDKGQCRHCGISDEDSMTRYGRHLEYDHIIPFSKNGADTEDNTQLLCSPCNKMKSNRYAG